jgi:hypothetical protein
MRSFYLSPELGLDPEVLPPGPIFSDGMTSRNWWMMRNLFTDVTKSSVVANTFVCFT